jgi:hypothetical protein
VALARTKGLVVVCREALRSASRLVGGCQEGVARFALLEAESRQAERAAAYARGVDRPWHALALDVRDAPGAWGRLQLVAGHLFPDRAYMEKRYGATGAVALAHAYARRAVAGAWRAFTAQPRGQRHTDVSP